MESPSKLMLITNYNITYIYYYTDCVIAIVAAQCNKQLMQSKSTAIFSVNLYQFIKLFVIDVGTSFSIFIFLDTKDLQKVMI